MVDCKKAASKLAKCSWKNKPKGPSGKYLPRSKPKLSAKGKEYKAKAARRKTRIKKLKKKLKSTKKVVKQKDATIKALQAGPVAQRPPVEARRSRRARKKPDRLGQ